MKNWIIWAIAAASTPVHASLFGGVNSPLNFSNSYVYEFSELPLEGAVPEERMPWSESYWPNNDGGISVRWNSDPRPPFRRYRLYSLDELKTMTQEQLEKLSPAEKFDIFMGNYSYPTVWRERGRVSQAQSDWHGICHGWAAAALNHPEPDAVVVENPDGIQVPFGSSDVKALLSYYYSIVASGAAGQIGSRCSSNYHVTRRCKDVNAGAFHIALANQLGIRQVGFAVEIDPGREIWNQPVYAYKTMAIGESYPTRRQRRNGVAREVVVETTITYADDEADYPRMYPTNGTEDHHSDTKTYRYVLELNGRGQVIGGSWLQRNHPDFIWLTRTLDFSHKYYGNIKRVYTPAY